MVLVELRCDYCGKAVEEQTSVGWFKVERIGIEVLAYGHEPGPWHFDTGRCIEQWAFAALGGLPE